MSASARDIMRTLISVYPVKEQPANPNRDWLGMLREKDKILMDFDLENISRLDEILRGLMPDVNFVFELCSRFGTQNVIVEQNGKKASEVSYYLVTGVLFGVMLKTQPKFQLEQKITLNKAGYNFTSDPLMNSKHPGNLLAQTAIKRFLFDLYQCKLP